MVSRAKLGDMLQQQTALLFACGDQPKVTREWLQSSPQVAACKSKQAIGTASLPLRDHFKSDISIPQTSRFAQIWSAIHIVAIHTVGCGLMHDRYGRMNKTLTFLTSGHSHGIVLQCTNVRSLETVAHQQAPLSVQHALGNLHKRRLDHPEGQGSLPHSDIIENGVVWVVVGSNAVDALPMAPHRALSHSGTGAAFNSSVTLPPKLKGFSGQIVSHPSCFLSISLSLSGPRPLQDLRHCKTHTRETYCTTPTQKSSNNEHKHTNDTLHQQELSILNIQLWSLSPSSVGIRKNWTKKAC